MIETKQKKKTEPNIGVTPVMQQYLRIKERFPQEIVFFRLGDFYEMFFEDAIHAAPILEVALTKRQTTPMCGVPHHSSRTYIAKLLKAGKSVAMAEQLEDPKKTKGMVKRDVVRVLTPGTIVEDELLPSSANNFLAAFSMTSLDKKGAGSWTLAAADVSTGKLWVGGAQDDLNWNQLKSQLAALNPTEILLVGENTYEAAKELNLSAVVRLEPTPGQGHVAQKALENYIERHQSLCGAQLEEAEPLPTEANGILFLDESAIRHLELVDSAHPGEAGPTLFSVLDKTSTSLGGRLLRWWILHPSMKLDVIRARHNQVEDLMEDQAAREKIRALLREVSDLERIRVRSLAGTSSPRDLAALRNSIKRIPDLQKTIQDMENRSFEEDFIPLQKDLDVSPDLVHLLDKELAEDPPFKVSDGNVIKEGINAELDELKALKRSGRKWIAQMEAEEREKTGITNLKVGYNDVFGYFLEVSKSHIPKVPGEWIRKQTLTNAERYITPSLKEQEEKILGAQEKIERIESALFIQLVKKVAGFSPDISKTAQSFAHLDAVSSLAEVAVLQGYVRPDLSEGDQLFIKGGRHPVIEKQMGRDRFIPNDLMLGPKDRRISIITGPNMAGKSTYLRQTALITIMAQMGSFVPAEQANIGLVDKIYTRIGASDRLSQGQSTFMVEMSEVATLLHNATSRSLLILDEVGRGTSTYDGVSIAWAVIHTLSGSNVAGHRSPEKNAVIPECRNPGSSPTLGPRTLFATHYFELTELPKMLPGVFNAHATAKEWPGPDGRRQVVFLYQIQPGPADRSYGIHVAEMAGVPEECIKEARQILKQLESGSHQIKVPKEKDAEDTSGQLDFFGEHPIVSQLKKIHVEQLTPLEALNELAKLKKLSEK